jgi:hypothetical protein
VRAINFAEAIERTKAYLDHNGRPVDTGHWQGVPTEGRPDLQTIELLDVQWQCLMPQGENMKNPLALLQREIQPNLPWADDHFEERVSRVPSNPGEQYMNWPWWRGQDDTSRTEPGLRFTHTYQERYWPKHAVDDSHWLGKEGHRGIRYTYGDLDDLVSLLYTKPYTRQAWLPIFFPEDTGAVHEGRVPCTLGYQFMLRDDRLHMWYVIRSCDYVRHFRDDLYLSARLLLWVLELLKEWELRDDKPQIWVDVQPGIFHFHCFSLHYHRGDEHLLRRR